MDTLTFSGGTMLGLSLTVLFWLALPVTVFFLLRSRGRAQIFPVIAGAVTYFLAVRFNDLTAHLLLFRQPVGVQAAAALELVAIFEETGRYLAMRFPLSDVRRSSAAVCYAVGHAGLECWSRAVQMIGIIGKGIDINRYGIAHFTAALSDEAAKNVTEQLQYYADTGLFVSLLDCVHIITNFGVHTALSLLIFKKLIGEGFRLRVLAGAILLHYALNCVSWLASLTGSRIFTSLVGIVTGTAIILLVSRIIDGRQIIGEIFGTYQLRTENDAA